MATKLFCPKSVGHYNWRRSTRMLLLTFCITLTGGLSALAQTNPPQKDEADELLQERYKWKVVKSDTSTWLVLVAPYSSVTPKGMRGTLMLMVKKGLEGDRPGRIELVFNEKVNPEKMVDFQFYTDEENPKEQEIVLATTATDKTDSFSVLGSVNGFDTDMRTGQRVDVFMLFSTFDILKINFFIKKKEMRSLVPIKWFRKQYAEL